MLQSLIRDNPVLLLFLVLGIGYVIGGIRFGSFKLGAVAGVLLAGLLLGHLGFEGNAAIQSFGFVLFIFSVGYQAGPKFVQAIRKDGRRYLLIAVIVADLGEPSIIPISPKISPLRFKRPMVSPCFWMRTSP